MWILTINIKNCKRRAKVTEHATKKTPYFRFYKGDWRLMIMAVIVNSIAFSKLMSVKTTTCKHRKQTKKLIRSRI
jgi:hypothetical protein